MTLKDNSVYTVLLCLHVADPATCPASNSVQGTCFPLRAACLFADGTDTSCLSLCCDWWRLAVDASDDMCDSDLRHAALRGSSCSSSLPIIDKNVLLSG